MCGIIALYARRREVDPETVRRATASLQHRGPDGQRHWKPGPPGRARPCAAQHHRSRRPAISRSPARTGGLASSSTASSMATRRSSASSSRRATACARARTARSRCISTRISGRNACTACAASSLSCFGTRANRMIFAARDRFGIKPLFYAFHDGTLYLASEVKALFAAGVPARWDAEIVYHCSRIWRPSDAHAVRWGVPGAARPLPDRDRQARPGAHATGISTIPSGRWRRRQRSDADYAGRVSSCARGGGAHPPAGRRAGRLLSERRARLLRGPRPGGAPSSRADSRLHPDLRPR